MISTQIFVETNCRLSEAISCMVLSSQAGIRDSGHFEESNETLMNAMERPTRIHYCQNNQTFI